MLDAIQMAAAGFSPRTFIKPEIIESIQKYKVKFDEAVSEINKVRDLKSTKLKAEFDAINQRVEKIFQEFLSHETTNLLADILGNHINEYKTIDAFKEKLKKSKGIENISDFIDEVTDRENYDALKEAIIDLSNVEALLAQRQFERAKNALNTNIADEILEANGKINIEATKAGMRVKIAALGKELNFSALETEKLQALFDKYTDRHLLFLKNQRSEMLKYVKPYLTYVRYQVLTLHPELQLQSERKEGKRKEPITHQYQQSSKRKLREEEVQEEVLEEEAEEEAEEEINAGSDVEAEAPKAKKGKKESKSNSKAKSKSKAKAKGKGKRKPRR